MENTEKKVQTPAIKFGTDGWRGIIAQDFTFDNVRHVAEALGLTFDPKTLKKNQKIFVGYDHRFMADRFAKIAVRTLRAQGYDAHLTPIPVTSPLLSFMTWKGKAPFGVMLTASHNPPQYLGFKVKGSFGGSIFPETVAQIEKNLAIVLENATLSPKLRAAHKPLIDKKMLETPLADNPIEDYIKYLHSHIDINLLKKSKQTVLFDAMYGPGAAVIKAFFDSFKHQLNVSILHDKHDPLFGGLHPEPIEAYLQELKEAVQKKRAHLGCAVDGDADRLGLVDNKGQYLTPPQVFSLLLYYFTHYKKMKGKVVQAVSLGYISQRIAKEYNLQLQEVPVGFKHVAQQMVEGPVLIGGEESGGYGFSKTHEKAVSGSLLPERDGLLSALLFLEMVCATGKSVGDILKEMEKKYGTSCFLRNDIHLDKPIEDKNSFLAKVQKLLPAKWQNQAIQETQTLDGLKVILADGSWFLIRPSGTEPLLRTYAEFPIIEQTQETLKKLEPLILGLLK